MLHTTANAAKPGTAAAVHDGHAARSRRAETLTAVYFVVAAVVMWVTMLVGTVMVLLFADAAVVSVWLAGGLVAFPAVSMLMRNASQRLSDAITAAGR